MIAFPRHSLNLQIFACILLVRYFVQLLYNESTYISAGVFTGKGKVSAVI